MVFVWREDPHVLTYPEAELVNYCDLVERGFNPAACSPVPRPFPRSVLRIHSINAPDTFFAGLVFVVADSLKNLLTRYSVNAEFLGLQTRYQGKLYTKKKFFIANLLDVVECFDYKKSIYKTTKYGVDKVKKLVLDESKTTGHHLFRVGPISTAKLNPKAVCDLIRCVSQELANQILELGFSGAVFSKPSEWRDFIPV